MKWLWLLLLGGAALEDARTGYISDGWSIAIGMSGLILSAARGEELLTLLSCMTMLSFLAILSLIWKEGMGEGDWYLLLAISTWLTLPLTILCVAISFWSALPEALYRFCSHGEKTLRFAPYIAIGGGVAFVIQEWAATTWRLYSF